MHDRAGRRKTVAWFTRNILPEEVIVKGTLVSLGLDWKFISGIYKKKFRWSKQIC